MQNKNRTKFLANRKKSRTFALAKRENLHGSIAQLVQSICLTSRGS